ncbi:hypothetical protein chiPu_0001177 [Chiloscyllium punctatum]|uniref:Uncharacterized protein n=1 Tax=Chiloscyllium punctatum TaxID=137246 RepID=A0A401RXA9_CHIPU|nr:hypothetical protein [Chiloscyllium punctatum]
MGRPINLFKRAPAVERQLGSIPATEFPRQIPGVPRGGDEGEIGGGHLGLKNVTADGVRVVPGVRHRSRTLLREVVLGRRPLPHQGDGGWSGAANRP